MTDQWEPADSVAKNDAGEYQALIGGQWVPASAAAKNDAGQFTVIRASKPALTTAQDQPVRVVGQLGIHSRSGIIPPKGDSIEEFGGRVTDKSESPLLGTLARMAPDLVTSFMGMGAGSLAKPAIQAKAADIMQSALKPTAAMLERGQGQKAIQTTLEEGISASKGGIEKLQKLINPIDEKITGMIEGSTAQVPESAFGRAFKEVVDQARYAPPSESTAVRKAISDFKEKFYSGGGTNYTLPVQDVQKIKQAYYRALGPENYGIVVGGEREGMKAVARGAKEAVAEAVPGVAKENDKLGPLLNALDVVERRVNLAPNRDIGGWAWLAHSIKGTIAALVARDPYTKSLLARGLYSGVAPAAPVGGAALAVGAQEAPNLNNQYQR